MGAENDKKYAPPPPKKTIHINYVSILLTYIHYIKLYFTNFWNKKKALNNISHSSAILVLVIMRKIDKSKAKAGLQLQVSWTSFLRRVYYIADRESRFTESHDHMFFWGLTMMLYIINIFWSLYLVYRLPHCVLWPNGTR